MVEDSADGQCSDVCGNGSHSEHKVEVNLDARFFGRWVIWRCACFSVGALLFQDGLDGGVSEDDSCREEAVYYCCGDLNYMGRG